MVQMSRKNLMTASSSMSLIGRACVPYRQWRKLRIPQCHRLARATLRPGQKIRNGMVLGLVVAMARRSRVPRLPWPQIPRRSQRCQPAPAEKASRAKARAAGRGKGIAAKARPMPTRQLSLPANLAAMAARGAAKVAEPRPLKHPSSSQEAKEAAKVANPMRRRCKNSHPATWAVSVVAKVVKPMRPQPTEHTSSMLINGAAKVEETMLARHTTSLLTSGAGKVEEPTPSKLISNHLVSGVAKVEGPILPKHTSRHLISGAARVEELMLPATRIGNLTIGTPMVPAGRLLATMVATMLPGRRTVTKATKVAIGAAKVAEVAKALDGRTDGEAVDILECGDDSQ